MKTAGSMAARIRRSSQDGRLPAFKPIAPHRATESVGHFRLTALIHRSHPLCLYRAAPLQETIGPGCYAIKIIRAARGSQAGTALLRREAAVLKSVSSPHLPASLTERLAAPQAYIAFAYLEGLSLRRRLVSSPRGAASQDRLTPAAALAIVRQLAAALTALHEAGWLHGQIRPEHALLSPRGFVTLIDLSQARRLDTPECDVAGQLPSAPHYAASECFGANRRLCCAADIYSLGIMLYELLCGQPPFVGGDAKQIAYSHRAIAPADIRRECPRASMELAELVRQMLAKEPLRRPTAPELVRLTAALEIEELAQ